ncbi:MAG: DNA primase [Acidobacteria bacterium]|nr:DNA primase [Acidobacteriota bacterium]
MSLAGDGVDRVKSAADLVQIVGEHVRLRKSGSNFIGLCPFHSEKTPSFHVHAERQFFYCFGCHAKGDVIHFVEKMEGLTFADALRWLGERYGIPIDSRSRPNERKAGERRILLEIQTGAGRYFHRELAGGGARLARRYLEDRGLTPEIQKRFGIGYAPRRSDGLLQELRGGYSLDQLRLSGLIQRSERDSSHYDRFRGRVMFPIWNEAGKIVGFGGRALGEEQPKYLNSPETPLYSKSGTLYALNLARESIRRQGRAVLVEGYMDCIALHQAGVGNAVAVCGTSLTEDQVRLLGRFTKKVVVNFDPDDAGDSATLRSLALLLQGGFGVRVLALPDGLDPDAYIRRRGADAYRQLLERAPSDFEYLLARARDKHPLETIEGKVGAIEELLPYLARVSNRIEREEKTRRLAEYFQVEETAVRAELQKAAGGGRRKLELGRSRKPSLSPVERQLIKVILDLDREAGKIVDQLDRSQVHVGMESEVVFSAMVALYRKEGRVEAERLRESLPGDREQNWISEAVFEVGDQEQVDGCLEWLGRKKVQREVARLQQQIEQAERSRDFELVASLHSRKEKLTLSVAG